MAQRKDGKKTRALLLNAACEIFGKKGFRDAKVTEICRQAGTNVAAVNYHFGSKAALYVEAWREALERDVVPDPPESETDPPEARLRERVYLMLQKFCDQGSRGQFIRLYLMELANPTGLIDESWRRLIEPKRLQFQKLLRELLGPAASEEAVLLCELSILNQCRGFIILRRNDLEYFLKRPLTPEAIRQMADHITRFSLAGIRDMVG